MATIWIVIGAVVFLLIITLVLWKIFGAKKGLMPCVDCGRKISRRAAFCPGCGRKPGGGLWIALFVALVIAMVAGGLYFVLLKPVPPQSKWGTKARPKIYKRDYGTGSGYYKKDYGTGSGSYYHKKKDYGSKRGYGSGSGS